MKKLLSVLLCILMVLCTVSPVFADENTNTYPIITVEGRNEDYPYVNADGEVIYPNNLDTEQIIDEVKECMPLFAKAIVTDDYAEWVAKVTDIFAAYYEGMLPDKDGNITNGSHISGWKSPVYTIGDDIDKNASCFYYDWRLSPVELADYLNEYIQQVKERTGEEKVSLFGRCLGCNVLSAYLCKYGCDDIDTVAYGASTVLGAEKISAVFSGNIAIDASALVNYVTSQESLTGDEAIDSFIFTLLEFLQSVYGLNLTAKVTTALLEKIYSELAPSLLRVSYGRYPSMWSLVSPECYEQAKAFVFSGYEDEFSGLIEKTDSYYAVQEKIENLLEQKHNDGLKVAVFAKYNLSMLPVSAEANMLNDETVLTSEASFGATCAENGKKLSKSETANVPAQYLSSDGVINSSTCLFPDNTWFIKNLGHSTYNDDFYVLLKKICHSDTEVTVNTFEEYPSFLQWNAEDNSLSPIEASDEDLSSTAFLAVKDRIVKFLNFVNAFLVILNILVGSVEKITV